MSPLSNDNRYDSSGKNPTLVIEMVKDELDRCHIAQSLGILIRTGDLKKDYIYRDLMDIALAISVI